MSHAKPPCTNASPLCALLLAALLVSGCAEGGSSEGDAHASTFDYACADDFAFRVEIDGPTVRVFLPETTAELKRAEAASGAKYQGDGVTFWSKGDGALLQTPVGTHRDCAQRSSGSVPTGD